MLAFDSLNKWMFIMRNSLLAAAICAVTMLLIGSPAYAQATRTWVSGVGDDANPCSRTAPCKTFAGAISKTAPGGEIDALDPGGFGAVTITKAITIDGGGGQVASVLVSGTNGIVVQAGGGDTVILRNLRINGISSGINGIRFLSGKQLVVDRVDVFGFTNNGLDVALSGGGSVVVRDSTFTNITQNAINVTTSAGAAEALIADSSVSGANIGVNADNGSFVQVTKSNFLRLSNGVQAAGSGNLSVTDSVIYNCTANGVASAGGTTVNVNGNTLINNTNAFQVAGTFNSGGDNKIIGATANPNGSYTTK